MHIYTTLKQDSPKQNFTKPRDIMYYGFELIYLKMEQSMLLWMFSVKGKAKTERLLNRQSQIKKPCQADLQRRRA